MESMINRWEVERKDTLTAKVTKLNQKVHCRARGRHAACLSRAIAMRRRRHTVSKNYFVLLLTLLVCLFLMHRGCARLQKSFSDHPSGTTRGGHCAQPSIYQLATAVDPATAARGAAAAAAGAGGPGAAGAAAAAGKNK